MRRMSRKMVKKKSKKIQHVRINKEMTMEVSLIFF